MAAYTLRSEASNLRPEFEYGLTNVRRAVTGSDRVRGAYHRRQIEGLSRDVATLRWAEGSEGQRELLLGAWNATRGVVPMNYTPLGDIDANAIDVWFTRRPTFRRTGRDTWAMVAEIEEDI